MHLFRLECNQRFKLDHFLYHVAKQFRSKLATSLQLFFTMRENITQHTDTTYNYNSWFSNRQRIYCQSSWLKSLAIKLLFAHSGTPSPPCECFKNAKRFTCSTNCANLTQQQQRKFESNLGVFRFWINDFNSYLIAFFKTDLSLASFRSRVNLIYPATVPRRFCLFEFIVISDCYYYITLAYRTPKCYGRNVAFDILCKRVGVSIALHNWLQYNPRNFHYLFISNWKHFGAFKFGSQAILSI